MASLLGGRNQVPLEPAAIGRVIDVCLALDHTVNVRYETNSLTRFRVVPAADGEPEYGEVVFSEDIYPGTNLANPNAALSMRAAAAHELTHYQRWHDMRSLDGEQLRHLDEAETSLEAAQRFGAKLNDIEVIQLIADALERLRLHRQS